MFIFRPNFLSAVLVAATTFAITIGVRGTAAMAGCGMCVVNGCILSPGEWTVPGPITFISTCVAFSNPNTPHCATTERQEKTIYAHDPTYKNVVDKIGFCYKEICSAATPTQVPCGLGWTPPWPVPGRGQTPKVVVPSSSSTCSVGKGG